MYLASNYGHEDVVLALLKAGGEPDAFTTAGSSSLLIAVVEGHADVAEILVKNKANVTASDRDGVSPIMTAVQFSKKNQAAHVRMAKLLLDAGADPNSPNDAEQTLLWIATYNGDSQVVKLLLEKGSDVNR